MMDLKIQSIKILVLYFEFPRLIRLDKRFTPQAISKYVGSRN